MTKAYTYSIILPLLGLLACSSTDGQATSDTEAELNALPGARQAALRAATGEDIVLAFDPTQGTVPNRPECKTIVANPLRIAVSKGSGITANSVTANLDTFIRSQTIAYTQSASESPGSVTLTRVNAVSFRAEIPNVIIGKTCSGSRVEYFQNLSVALDGKALVDPIGNKATFSTELAAAKGTGTSALARHSVSLRSVAGTKVVVEIGKLAGDDPAQPATCTQIQAIPARITVTPSTPAQKVTATLENVMRGPTVAATLAPTSPGALTFTKNDDGTFSSSIPPFVIASRCSGTPMDYSQKLVVTTDGTPEVDPVGGKPTFLLELAKAQ